MFLSISGVLYDSYSRNRTDLPVIIVFFLLFSSPSSIIFEGYCYPAIFFHGSKSEEIASYAHKGCLDSCPSDHGDKHMPTIEYPLDNGIRSISRRSFSRYPFVSSHLISCKGMISCSPVHGCIYPPLSLIHNNPNPCSLESREYQYQFRNLSRKSHTVLKSGIV